MKRTSILTLAVIALSSFMAITVWAASPHFINCSASGVNSDGSLNVCFKIAGLGTNQLVTVTASATADAVYGCLNGGQQCPNAANKVQVKADVSATGTFNSGKNGQVTACLTVEPPPTTLTCPNGQKRFWFRSVTRTFRCHQTRARTLVSRLLEPSRRTSSRSVRRLTPAKAGTPAIEIRAARSSAATACPPVRQSGHRTRSRGRTPVCMEQFLKSSQHIFSVKMRSQRSPSLPHFQSPSCRCVLVPPHNETGGK
jgi:hypothetical protein